jgi:hypothetical protein
MGSSRGPGAAGAAAPGVDKKYLVAGLKGHYPPHSSEHATTASYMVMWQGCKRASRVDAEQLYADIPGVVQVRSTFVPGGVWGRWHGGCGCGCTVCVFGSGGGRRQRGLYGRGRGQLLPLTAFRNLTHSCYRPLCTQAYWHQARKALQKKQAPPIFWLDPQLRQQHQQQQPDEPASEAAADASTGSSSGDRGVASRKRKRERERSGPRDGGGARGGVQRHGGRSTKQRAAGSSEEGMFWQENSQLYRAAAAQAAQAVQAAGREGGVEARTDAGETGGWRRQQWEEHVTMGAQREGGRRQGRCDAESGRC